MNEKKQYIYEFWNESSKTFGFRMETIKVWSQMYAKRLPDAKERKLKILDVGCGTGFISAAVGMLGHEITGVDLCEGMVEQASKNTKEIGLEISFICTDAGELPFEDETFDMVVCRNLTWTLLNPEEVFVQWKRVLKKDGLLMYSDANWYHYLYDEQLKKVFDESPYQGKHTDNYKELELEAYHYPMSSRMRPAWDAKHLPELGYEIIDISDISDEVRNDQEKLIYAFAPQFLVTAKKKEEV